MGSITNIKVSIIIPVYNVEKYVGKCLDSVLNQTLKEIEIICVNDGSTDNSSKILEEYAEKDKRIIIINKQNSGLGAARNTGMEYATGEYIGFLDSDDWVHTAMYEKLYKNGKFHGSDIVMCPMLIVNEINENLSDYSYYDLNCFSEDFNNCVFDHKKTKDFMFKIAVNAYNKIYRTEFIKKINAKFPEGLIFEDNPFFYYTYLNASNLSIIRDFLYFHRINRQNSIISEADNRFFDIIKIHNLILEIFLCLPNYGDYEIILLNRKISGILYRYSQVSDSLKQEFFKLIKVEFEEMNLKNEKKNALNVYTKNNYVNIIKSDSSAEFGLRKEKNHLFYELNKLTKQNKLLFKDNNQMKTDMQQLKVDNNNLKNQLKHMKNEIGKISNIIRSCEI